MPTRVPDEADPPTRALLEWVDAAAPPPLHGMAPEDARRAFDERRARVDLDPVPLARIEDLAFDGPGGPVPVRLYGPRPAGGAPLPLLVYFHGGGFVIGNLESHDSLCRRLADGAGCLVAAVDYRLAPEHPFPAAAEDAVAALDWAAENAAALGADGERVAVAGDSAGGTLAAVAARHARDRGAPALRAQVLVYPGLDPANRHASTAAFADVFPIDKAMLAWFYGHYFGGRPAPSGDPRAAPGLAADLAGLAPATILTAGLDPLCDEGAAYAERLREAGVAVDYVCYEGTGSRLPGHGQGAAARRARHRAHVRRARRGLRVAPTARRAVSAARSPSPGTRRECRAWPVASPRRGRRRGRCRWS